MVSLRVDSDRLNSATLTAPREETPAVGEAQAQPQDQLFCAGEVHILILDDDPSVGRVIQSALARRDFKVDTVSDPTVMEAKLQERPYHIVILDYVIPGLESAQVMEWVRNYQPDASVIVVTGFPSIDSALHCLRSHTCL